jgi:hypothetical protein
VLVFYVGNIVDDKNTLCYSCIFNRMIGVYLESSCIQTMFKSKLMTDQKLLEDVHEDSLQNSKPKEPFLCNRLDEPLKASGLPAVSYR